MSVLESLKSYKGILYGDINLSLRENISLDKIDPTIRRHIENIDSSMKNGDRDIILYRGIPRLHSFLEYYKDIDEEKIGTPRIIELGFSSASKKIDVTRSFVDKIGCCVLSFVLPKEIKRYDFSDKYEDEILIERNIQFILQSDEPLIDTNRKLQIYKAIVKSYIPPKITEKDIKLLDKIDEELGLESIESIAREIYEELKDESFGDITEDDINTNIKSYSHWTETKKQLVKNKLLEIIKNE
jgi:hypothetical protein